MAGVKGRSGRKTKAQEFGFASLIKARLSKAKQGQIIDNLFEFATGDDAKAAVSAASLLFAYAYGKPTEKHEVGGAGGGPITLKVVYSGKP